MSKNAKRLLTAALLIAGLMLPTFAAAPEINENVVSIGCVSVSTLGNIQFVSETGASGTPGAEFSFGLKLGENWVLRGIEIFDADKNPIDFDITGIYHYSFTIPEGGAKILARSEDHATAARADAVVELWKLADKPVVDYLMTYSDVSADADYCEAVRWAESEGLITVGENFRPDDPITREELAVIIYRRACTLGLDTDDDFCILLDSVDRDSVSEWALEAVCWNVTHDVMNEFSGASGYFKPQEYLTRNDLFETICALNKLYESNIKNGIPSDENPAEGALDGENNETESESAAKTAPVKCPPINIGSFFTWNGCN